MSGKPHIVFSENRWPHELEMEWRHSARSIVRMRNLIVHGYDVVDPEILFDAATGRLGDFRRFRDEIDLANAKQEPAESIPPSGA
ncbi:MAG: HepT-like ribonuclease domain-containing protein [bacterium]